MDRKETKVYVTVMLDVYECIVTEVKAHETSDKAKEYAHDAYLNECEEAGIPIGDIADENEQGTYNLDGWSVTVREIETPWLS